MFRVFIFLTFLFSLSVLYAEGFSKKESAYESEIPENKTVFSAGKPEVNGNEKKSGTAEVIHHEYSAEITKKEAVKIVNSRKIHKTDSDPVEKLPILLPKKTNEEKEREIIQQAEEEHPKIINFMDSLEDHGLDDVTSFGIDYTLKNLINHSFGLKLELEKKITKFLSGKGKVSVQTRYDSDSGLNFVVWNGGLSAYGYPFCKGLEWLYLGAGLELDYFTYSGSNNIYSGLNDAAISFVPSVGWKQFFFRNIMLDFNVSYKLNLKTTEHNDSNLNYLDSGFQFSLGYTIMWNRVLRRFITDYILKKF